MIKKTTSSVLRKYRNIPVEYDGVKFDSKGEAVYYFQLKFLEKHGKIKRFRKQVPFILIPGEKLGRRKLREIKIIIDFVVETNEGKIWHLDFKGKDRSGKYRAAQVYWLKKRLFQHQYKVDLVEVSLSEFPFLVENDNKKNFIVDKKE